MIPKYLFVKTVYYYIFIYFLKFNNIIKKNIKIKNKIYKKKKKKEFNLKHCKHNFNTK